MKRTEKTAQAPLGLTYKPGAFVGGFLCWCFAQSSLSEAVSPDWDCGSIAACHPAGGMLRAAMVSKKVEAEVRGVRREA